MTKLMLGYALSTCAALGFADHSLAANIVTNGGFETGDFGGWTQGGNTASTTVNGTVFLAHSGSYSVGAGPFGSGGTLNQDLTTDVGKQYSVSFWLNNRFDNVGNFFTASFGGVELLNISDVSPFPYKKYSFATTATATVSTLSFGFRNDSSFWYLDDIAVATSTGAIPEPASWAMMIVGFGLIGGRMRQRSPQSMAAPAVS